LKREALDSFDSLFRKDGEAFSRDVGKAALHLEHGGLATIVHGDHAFAKRGHEGRMTGKHAEIAFRPGGVDLVDVTGEQFPLRRDQRKVKLASHGS